MSRGKSGPNEGRRHRPPAAQPGHCTQSQPVPNIIEYIDIMQLAFREGRSELRSYFYTLLSLQLVFEMKSDER